MSRLISKLQVVNWNRGLHRVFALLCLLWLGFFFVYIPWKEIQVNTKYAAETFVRELNHSELAGVPMMPADELEALTKENWERATWSYQYKNLLSSMPTLIWVIVLIPTVVYGLARLFIFLVLWLYRGFKPAQDQS